MRTLPTISKQTTSTSLCPWSLRTEQNLVYHADTFNGEMVSELTSYGALNSLGRVVDRHHALRCTNHEVYYCNSCR